jgi:hypothetical protein
VGATQRVFSSVLGGGRARRSSECFVGIAVPKNSPLGDLMVVFAVSRDARPTRSRISVERGSP